MVPLLWSCPLCFSRQDGSSLELCTWVWLVELRSTGIGLPSLGCAYTAVVWLSVGCRRQTWELTHCLSCLQRFSNEFYMSWELLSVQVERLPEVKGDITTWG